MHDLQLYLYSQILCSNLSNVLVLESEVLVLVVNVLVLYSNVLAASKVKVNIDLYRSHSFTCKHTTSAFTA